MRAGRAHVDRIERLARRHEQTVAARSAEAHVRAVLRQANHSDAFTARRDDLHSGTRTGPDISIRIAANSIGGRRRSRSGNIELNEPLPVAQALTVDVVDADVAARTGVGDIELLVVG